MDIHQHVAFSNKLSKTHPLGCEVSFPHNSTLLHKFGNSEQISGLSEKGVTTNLHLRFFRLKPVARSHYRGDIIRLFSCLCLTALCVSSPLVSRLRFNLTPEIIRPRGCACVVDARYCRFAICLLTRFAPRNNFICASETACWTLANVTSDMVNIWSGLCTVVMTA